MLEILTKTEATGLSYSPHCCLVVVRIKTGKPTDAPIGADRTVSFPDPCFNPATRFVPIRPANLKLSWRALPAASLV